MTTTTTINLLNNVARTNAIIALNNTSSPAPEWLVWTMIALVAAFVIAAVWVTVETW